MTFVARPYDDIVRDMLTTLTGGTVREPVLVPPDTLLMPKLRNHPVRRISHAEGMISITVAVKDPADAEKKIREEQKRPYRFTAADFELVSTTSSPNDLDAIRFREKGRKPVPGSTLIINYYPVQTEPVVLTDVAVGSVVRSILETIGIEMDLTYRQLEQVYKSAFLETAEGDSLDKVVALIGVRRLAAGRPVTRLRFSRRSGTAGQVTIPEGTPVTDGKGNRYLTTVGATLEAGESTREVMAAAASSSTAEALANTLTFFEIAIAGTSDVTNPEAAVRLTSGETDAQLRTRARAALRTTMRGTVDAIRFGLLAIKGVKDVSITERPNGVAGEIRVDVAYNDPSEAVKRVVADRLNDLRPAGIFVFTGEAAKIRVAVNVALTLAGSSLSPAQLQSVKDTASQKIEAVLKSIAPGGTVRRAQLTAAVLTDTRVVDATITLTPQGQAPAEQLTLPESTVLEAITPFEFAAPQFETAAAGLVTSTVTVDLPLSLVGTTTQAQVQAQIEAAVAAHLATRTAEAPLTVDALAVAIRDDTHFALVRADVLVTVESQGTFRQLSDGMGSYVPGANEKLQIATLNIDVRGQV